MSFELFIAKRLISAKDYKNSISAPIIKIAVTAIAIGIVMMLISVATGIGLKQKIREKIEAFNGHITIENLDNISAQVTDKPISKDQSFYPKFTAVPEVNHIQAIATKYGIIRTATDFEAVVIKGVGTDYRWKYLKNYLTQGRLPDYSNPDKYSREILLSEYMAKRLHFKLGDKVIVYFMNNASQDRTRLVAFTIVGIFNSGFREFDKTFLIADINQVQRLNKWDKNQVGGFEVFINDFDQLDQVGGQVYKQVGSFLDARTITQKYPAIFEWLSLFDFNIYLIIGIMIIVAGINMITALLVLILERTQMIGMLKALGSNDWSVRKVFLYNAAYLIGKGLFWGNLIGIGMLLVQKYFKIIPLDPSTYYVTEAPVYLSIGYILLINIGTLALCLLMLLVPSYIITKITPVKAIRFE